MPLKKCSSDGKPGYKWGDQGHCYTGPGGKKAAIRQGIAIEGPDKFKKIQESEGSKITIDDIYEILQDPTTNDDEFSELATFFKIPITQQASCNIVRIREQMKG